MRRSPDRAGRSLFPPQLAGRGEETEPRQSAVRRRSSLVLRHDAEDDGGREGRSAGWRQPRSAAGSFPWSAGPASVLPVTSRQRTAWMLAHVPDHNSGQDDARRIEVAQSRLDARGFQARYQDADAQSHDPRSGRDHYAQLLTSKNEAASTRGSLPDGPTVQARSARYHGEGAGYWEEAEHRKWLNGDEEPRARSRGYEDKVAHPLDDVGYMSDDAADDMNQASAVQTADTEMIEEPNVPKTSRYLREMDRRVILERLERGEKQAPLAKEFNVSRAAISNLYKHRHEILARTDEDPFAKHPKKKKRTKSTKARTQRAQSLSAVEVMMSDAADGKRSSPGSDEALQPKPTDTAATDAPTPHSSILVAKSRALPILLSSMGDVTRSCQEFRRVSERALWLLLEEALASVPLDASDADCDTCPGFTARLPPCAITMEHDTLDATPMLDIFQLMEPQQPSAVASVATHRDDAAFTVEIAAGGRLPPALRGYNVFLLDVVAASGEAVCAVVERLVRGFGVLEANVSVVALFTSSEVVAMVQCKYPLATIVTARIDSSITRRRIASTPVDVIVSRMRDAYCARR